MPEAIFIESAQYIAMEPDKTLVNGQNHSFV